MATLFDPRMRRSRSKIVIVVGNSAIGSTNAPTTKQARKAFINRYPGYSDEAVKIYVRFNQ